MAFSIQKHWEIIFLHTHKLGPKLSLHAIAKELHCSSDTVQTWINRYQDTGDVQDEQGRGRKRKTSDKEDTNIVSMAKRLRSSTLKDISLPISKQGVGVFG